MMMVIGSSAQSLMRGKVFLRVTDVLDRTEPLVEAEGIRKEFTPRRGDTIVAVDDVSLRIPAGASLDMVGESGSGKMREFR